jgi:hypothetical protein
MSHYRTQGADNLPPEIKKKHKDIDLFQQQQKNKKKKTRKEDPTQPENKKEKTKQ